MLLLRRRQSVCQTRCCPDYASELGVLRHERLGSPEAICLEYLNEHDIIANAKLRELTGITSENTAKEVSSV